VAQDAPTSDAAEIAELTALIRAVRDRVSARYPEPGLTNGTSPEALRVPIVDLMPIVHARDAAQAKIAAIGSVNPRPGGLVNSLIQKVKRAVARALGWFVRDQVAFNRETVSAIEAALEVLNQQNRALQNLASQASERLAELDAKTAAIEHKTAFAAQQLDDIRTHWAEWRAGWERNLTHTEVQLLRGMAELQNGFQYRLSEALKAQHSDYLGALTRTSLEIQTSLRQDYERLIYSELRLIRQRGLTGIASATERPAQTVSASATSAASFSPMATLDYARFAEQFRGPAEHIRKNLEFYKPFYAGMGKVLDIGCGRGEFLEMMRDNNVPAEGIDLSEESVSQCRAQGLSAQVADAFPYLASQPKGEFDGVFSSQVVEHIETERLPELIRLCATRLRRGGVLAIETPNPDCLAIFATYFYLDPTHVRPVPHALLNFYMQEAGFGSIEVHPLSPAWESIPELMALPEAFRKRFFGGLDYAIIGRRL